MSPPPALTSLPTRSRAARAAGEAPHSHQHSPASLASLTSSRAATRMALASPATPDCSSAPSPQPWPSRSLAPSARLQLSGPARLLLGPSGFGADTTSSKKPPLTARGACSTLSTASVVTL